MADTDANDAPRDDASSPADREAAERGRAIVAEARAVRRRMLDDAEQRRRALVAELERVRAEVDAAIEQLRRAAPAPASPPARPPASPAGAHPTPPPAGASPAPSPPPGPTARVAPSTAPAGQGGVAPPPEKVERLFDALRAETPAPASKAPRPGAGTAKKATKQGKPRPAPKPTGSPDETTEPRGVAAVRPRAPLESDEPEPAVVGAESEAAAGPAEPAADGDGSTRPGDPVRRRDAVIEPLVPDVMRASKRLLQDEQNSLLDAVRRARGRHEPSRLLPEPVRQRESWTALLSRAIDAAYVGGRAASGKTGRVSNAPNRIVVELAALLVTPLRERIAATIEAVVAEGPYESTNELQRALGSAIGARFREWRTVDLEHAVLDVLAAAYARGAYDAAGPAAMLRWVPAEPGRCPDCDDNALEPTLKGKAFPTGQPHPPAHPGCRCVVLPAESDAGGTRPGI